MLTHEQVQAMLGAITRTTLQGWRDHARILLLVRTGLLRARSPQDHEHARRWERSGKAQVPRTGSRL